MSSQIPPLLEPYLETPPQGSLILATGVLGATTNWLVLRYIYSALGRKSAPRSGRLGRDEQLEGAATGGEPDIAVVLASFMRDFSFWRDGAARLGIDLDGFAKKGRFIFVDGLTGLFAPCPLPTDKGRRLLSSPEMDHVQAQLEGTISDMAEFKRVVFILDQPDAFLAATSGETAEPAIGNMILGLRERVHSMVMTVMADEPLLERQMTALEKNHATFVLSMAHQAELVASLRRLDTGTATDVSGVIRLTKGGTDAGREIEAHEYLYSVGTDGSVRVFERGQ